LAALRGGHTFRVRHVLFALCIALYVVVIAQNWAVYTGAILIVLWRRHDGRLGSIPFSL